MDNVATEIDCCCVSEEFSGFDLFRQLESYKGPVDPKGVVSEYIETETATREEEARKGGTLPLMQPSETIRPRLVRSLSCYVSLVTRVADFICRKALAQYCDADLSIVQVRTRFDFVTWLIKLLFVVDGTHEDVATFERLLRTVERIVLEEERFTAELEVLNQRYEKTDYKLLLRDFPFIHEDGSAL